jgi:NADH-quinone oxidoreductase subunit H
MQPLADALKLVMKEDITPAGVDKFIYFMAPMLAMVPALLAAAVIPFGPTWWTRITDLNHSVLYTFLLASLGVYAITLAGWASNNKYSLMGALRSAAQMISYELGMGLSLIVVVMLAGTFSLREIVEQQHLMGWNVFRAPTMFIAFLIFFICGIAETNRAPFDMAEAETELVAGFHTEYSSFKFAMFFMAEYVNMVIFSAVAVTLFMGGWSGPGVSYVLQTDAVTNASSLVPAGFLGAVPMALLGVFYFVAKVFFFLFVYMWIRASMPRFRYDQLMNFGWKRLVPISLANIFLMAMFIAWRRDWF